MAENMTGIIIWLIILTLLIIFNIISFFVRVEGKALDNIRDLKRRVKKNEDLLDKTNHFHT